MQKAARLGRRACAEFFGTAFLLMSIIGSGIMAERLSNGNAALTLLGNSISVGAALVCLILAFGSVSGAHFNPAVTLTDAMLGRFAWKELPVYFIAQITGAIIGVALANLMFDLPALDASEKVRFGASQLLGEFVATVGLILVIYGTLRKDERAVPFAVAAFITSAFWFTSSTSFANPAVSIARSMSNTFAGIRPLDVPAFVIAEFIAAAAAVFLVRWLFNNSDEKKTRVLILCTGNSARSQMAEGILRSIAGDKFDVESAGVSPSNVRPEAVKTMNEIGIDISGQRSKSVEEFTGATFDFMITVCDNAREICPILPGNAVKIHHNFEDPPAVGAASHEETMEIFRRVRDEIHDFLIKFSHGN